MRKDFWTEVYDAISGYKKHNGMDLQYVLMFDNAIVLYFSANGARDMSSQYLCTVPHIAR